MIEARDWAQEAFSGPAGEATSRARGGFRQVLALARVEGRRLITHPVFLVGPIPAILFVGGSGAAPGMESLATLFSTAFGYVTIGLGTLIAANLNALRSRRSRTEEQWASVPASAEARTAAQALAVGWAAGAALALSTGAALYLRVSGSLPLDTDFGEVVGTFDVLQGPVMVAFLGVLGICLARWVPTAVAGPLAVVGLFFVGFAPLYSESPARWFWFAALWNEAWEPAVTMGWHAVYVVGLTVMLGSLAAWRHGGGPPVRLAMVAGLLLAAVSGTLQFLAASPG